MKIFCVDNPEDAILGCRVAYNEPGSMNDSTDRISEYEVDLKKRRPRPEPSFKIVDIGICMFTKFSMETCKKDDSAFPRKVDPLEIRNNRPFMELERIGHSKRPTFPHRGKFAS